MNEERYPLGAPEGADTPNEVPAQGATWNDAVPTQGTALNDAAPLQGAAQGSAQTAQNAPAMQEDSVPMQKDDAPVQEAGTPVQEDNAPVQEAVTPAAQEELPAAMRGMRKSRMKKQLIAGIVLIAAAAVLLFLSVPLGFFGSPSLLLLLIGIGAAGVILLLCALYQKLMLRGFKNCPGEEFAHSKALAAIGATVLGLALIVLLVLGPVTQWDIGASFAIPVAIGGGVVLLCALGARLSAGAAAQGKPYSALPMAAISIDFGFAVLLFGGMFLYAVSNLLSLLGLLMAFLSIFTPFAGVACGIVALTKKNKLTKGGTALSIIAIALPVVVCAVVILLFSTGVWVIRLM